MLSVTIRWFTYFAKIKVLANCTLISNEHHFRISTITTMYKVTNLLFSLLHCFMPFVLRYILASFLNLFSQFYFLFSWNRIYLFFKIICICIIVQKLNIRKFSYFWIFNFLIFLLFFLFFLFSFFFFSFDFLISLLLFLFNSFLF